MHERAPYGLLCAERRQAILARSRATGKVVAARLVEDLGVSEDTIRRDLRQLAAQGLVQRVHGGALAARTAARLLRPPAGDVRRREGRARRGGGRAARRRGVILLDGSTTNLEVARRLPAGPHAAPC